MQIQSSGPQQQQNSNMDSKKSIWVDNSYERRDLELKRRFQGLQVRRDHLEKELQAVKNCLMSLDMQMKKEVSYRQLNINNQNLGMR